jgi:hypothetical protein
VTLPGGEIVSGSSVEILEPEIDKWHYFSGAHLI